MYRAVCRCVATKHRGCGFTRRAIKASVAAEIEPRSEETPQILISADASEPEAEPVAESEPKITEIPAEEKTETTPPPVQTSQAVSKPAPVSTEPKPGDRTVIDGKPHI